MTTFTTHLSPDDALGRIIDQADLIESLAAETGPGARERAGRIRISAGVIKDHAALLFGDEARGLELEDSESARRAAMDDPSGAEAPAAHTLRMSVRRIVPDLHARDPAVGHSFYVDVLGLEVAMDLGWIVTYAAPGEAANQISVMSQDATAAVRPDVSIEVDDVDAAHAAPRGSATRSCTR